LFAPDRHDRSVGAADEKADEKTDGTIVVKLRAITNTAGGLLAGMRIRKKLIVLHTLFSLTLALILVIALRPAIGQIVRQAELDEARLLLGALAAEGLGPGSRALDSLSALENVQVIPGSAEELALSSDVIAAARARPLEPLPGEARPLGECAVMYVPTDGVHPAQFVALQVRIPASREAVSRLYLLASLALISVYGFVAIALEMFVLPRNLYAPIRRLLDADEAVRLADSSREVIPEEAIPADELGEIMRSRNETIRLLRNKEAALADALDRLAQAASDLQKKNHLLEAAQRNLADADRLASLGMMSAGIAHELNTPLAVLKGLVDKLNAGPGLESKSIETAHAALLQRVVGRLERLGESLLDFARVRPAKRTRNSLSAIVQEAMTLVRLDRDRTSVELASEVDDLLVLECDGDRLVQVMVNLLRNAAEAAAHGDREPRVLTSAQRFVKEGQEWLSIRISDNGPGIDPAILPRLFEPFASTRLDARGTGLGLAVAEGIVREHGGTIVARNRTVDEIAASDRSSRAIGSGDGKTIDGAGAGVRYGAVFEVVLPVGTGGQSDIASTTISHARAE
jgi:C4-dicarboxylate-specific signal transduction histidine kinase